MDFYEIVFKKLSQDFITSTAHCSHIVICICNTVALSWLLSIVYDNERKEAAVCVTYSVRG